MSYQQKLVHCNQELNTRLLFSIVDRELMKNNFHRICYAIKRLISRMN